MLYFLSACPYRDLGDKVGEVKVYKFKHQILAMVKYSHVTNAWKTRRFLGYEVKPTTGTPTSRNTVQKEMAMVVRVPSPALEYPDSDIEEGNNNDDDDLQDEMVRYLNQLFEARINFVIRKPWQPWKQNCECAKKDKSYNIDISVLHYLQAVNLLVGHLINVIIDFRFSHSTSH